jgi:hypothetical protein
MNAVATAQPTSPSDSNPLEELRQRQTLPRLPRQIKQAPPSCKLHHHVRHTTIKLCLLLTQPMFLLGVQAGLEYGI